jgi:hydroxyacylglutathione hydrolase
MIVRRLFEPGLAQVSYLIACGASGDAIVVDPNRDIDTYLDAAAEEQVRITHVTETHIHADFLSGSRELARRAAATLHLSDEGDASWKYQFLDEGRPLKHGDRIEVGNVVVEAVHTPGHTPEHLTFLITDGAVADVPIAAITGDFIFVGDVGRPDLLERAASHRGTMERDARTLYRALRAFDASREEWLQIWPGHGAGSSCGKGISAVPYSTLGYERRFNWAFRAPDEDAFVNEILAGQPEPPTYFATMKRLNKLGPPMLNGFREPSRMDDRRLPSVIAQGVTVIDTRTAQAFAERHVPGTLNIPFTNSFATWVGWLVRYDQPLYLIVEDSVAGRLLDVVRALALIGVDQVSGFFGASVVDVAASKGTARTIVQIDPREVAAALEQGEVAVVDVRSEAEWQSGHLPGARHIPLGYLPDRVPELLTDVPIVVHCQTSSRSAIAASLLTRAGVQNVRNMTGGFAAWQAAELPTKAQGPA